MSEDSPMENRETIFPIYDNDYAAIVTYCSDSCAPYLSVFLKSLYAHSDASKNYDVIILTDSITERNKGRLTSGYEKSNISIRFLDVPDEAIPVDLESLRQRQRFSKESFCPIIVPRLLECYQKILYVEIDMCLQDDIYKIYSTELEGKTIGACLDHVMNGRCNLDGGMKRHLEEGLELTNYNSFFQTGLLLIDCDKYREDACEQKLLDYIQTVPLKTAEQGLFNKLFENQVCILDSEWNFENPSKSQKFVKILSAMEPSAREAYDAARVNPKNIHFAGSIRPWRYPDEENASVWWSFARQTVFYEELIRRMIKYHQAPPPKPVDKTIPLRREFLKIHFPNINNRFVKNERDLKLIFVMEHLWVFRFKKLRYKIKKAFAFGRKYDKYNAKYRLLRSLVKDASRLRRAFYRV